MIKKTISQAISQTFTFSLISLIAISNFSVNTNAQISIQNETQVLNEINKNRSQNNLKLLSLNEKLNKTANFYAQNLAQNNYLSHKGLDRQNANERMTKFGYNWTAFGENLAAGSDNPTITVERWMKSLGHKANILNSEFCEIGIGYGYSENSNYKHYWTANFGCREDFNSPIQPKSESKNEEKTQSQNMNQNAEDLESGENKKIPAIRSHYPYNSTTELINPSIEKNNLPNSQKQTLVFNSKPNSQQNNSKNIIKVSNFQTCKNAGGEISNFVYNSKNLVKCSISGHHFAIYFDYLLKVSKLFTF
jgi:uncharacterized protein YkwD